MKRKIRTGDEVVVISGNDRGKSGKILSCSDQRVIVEGVNIRKKHMKPTQQSQKGRIIELERSIHISNVKPSVNGEGVKLKVAYIKGNKELVYGKESYRLVKQGKS